MKTFFKFYFYLKVRPNYIVASNNHGLALSTMAKWTSDEHASNELFEQAYRCFAEISKPLMPTTYHCQSNYAMTLAAQARLQLWRGNDEKARKLVRVVLLKV